MINKYNSIAPLYYPLSKLVFGNDLYSIQEETLSLQIPTQKLLIIGGGNGQILPFLSNNCPQLEITFVEASSKMISMAKKNVGANQKVRFIYSDQFEVEGKFQNILLPFVLDILSASEKKLLMQKLHEWRDEDTSIYITDFYKAQSNVQKLILYLSIKFFKLTTGSPNAKLPDVFSELEKEGYKSLKNCHLQNKFIRGSILKYQL